MMKKKILIACIVLVVLTGVAGNTHRLLPASMDPCQTDISHASNLNELPVFHCIGHTEYAVDPGKDGLQRVARWDHRHPWMDLDWHLQRGFDLSHALKLVAPR